MSQAPKAEVASVDQLPKVELLSSEGGAHAHVAATDRPTRTSFLVMPAISMRARHAHGWPLLTPSNTAGSNVDSVTITIPRPAAVALMRLLQFACGKRQRAYPLLDLIYHTLQQLGVTIPPGT